MESNDDADYNKFIEDWKYIKNYIYQIELENKLLQKQISSVKNIINDIKIAV